jgi:hypothetical protein
MTEQQVAAVARRAAESAQPDLDAITEDVITRHKLDALAIEQQLLVRIGLALNDLQYQSFNLGVRIGAHLMLELARTQVE